MKVERVRRDGDLVTHEAAAMQGAAEGPVRAAVAVMSMRTVLLVGGTGNLGALIGRELLKRGARLRLLVRGGSRSKVPADLAQAAEIVEDDQAAFQGVSSVVSAVQGGPETIVDAQLRFLRAARQAGARRFIASDYSMNLFTVPEGDNVSSDHRREFARRAEAERGDVEVVQN